MAACHSAGLCRVHNASHWIFFWVSSAHTVHHLTQNLQKNWPLAKFCESAFLCVLTLEPFFNTPQRFWRFWLIFCMFDEIQRDLPSESARRNKQKSFFTACLLWFVAEKTVKWSVILKRYLYLKALAEKLTIMCMSDPHFSTPSFCHCTHAPPRCKNWIARRKLYWSSFLEKNWESRRSTIADSGKFIVDFTPCLVSCMLLPLTQTLVYAHKLWQLHFLIVFECFSFCWLFCSPLMDWAISCTSWT